LNWLEVSLVVDGEMAEAASEVLSRYSPDGVVIESTKIQDDPQNEGYPTGPLRIYAYLPVDEELEQKQKKLEQALWHLNVIRPLSDPRYRSIEQADWAESWKRHFQPVEISERLMVAPAWQETPDHSKVVIRIDPGMAFGTGAHPSTQLCLQMIEEWLISTHQPEKTAELTMIDLGCGSGILAIAALKLGVSHALGVDLDPEAMIVARANALSNNVAEQLDLQTGSLSEILEGNFSLRQADLVVANILAPVLVRMLTEGLGGVLAHNGCMILAGILEEQAAEVISAAKDQRLRLVDFQQMGDWVALGLEK